MWWIVCAMLVLVGTPVVRAASASDALSSTAPSQPEASSGMTEAAPDNELSGEGDATDPVNPSLDQAEPNAEQPEAQSAPAVPSDPQDVVPPQGQSY